MRSTIQRRRGAGERGAFTALLVLAMVLAAPLAARAEMMIPRDASNPYQLNPHAKLRHVLLYDNAPAHAGGRAALRASLARLAHRYGFQLDTSRVMGYIADSTLAGVDVVVFSNGDQDVLAPSEGSSTVAMERYTYEQGGALLMVHAAAAFLVCADGIYPLPPSGGPGPAPLSGCRFLARAAARQYYQHQANGTPMTVYVDSVRAGEVPPHGSLGAPNDIGPVPSVAAYSHGVANAETQAIFTGLPRTWPGLEDEWWSFVSSPRLVGDIPYTVTNLDSAVHIEGRVNVLLSIDERSHDWGNQRMGDHPIAWTRKMGHGLAAFNAAGHEDVYVQNDSIMEKFNGRLLRYLARDFVGCMNPVSLHYNPDATVERLTDSDPEDPCAGPSAVQPSRADASGLSVTGRAGVIRISWENPARYDLRIVDVTGKTVASLPVSEGGKDVTITSLEPGIYFVNVKAGNGARFARRVTLY